MFHGATPSADVVGMMTDEDTPAVCVTDCADVLARDPSSTSGVYSIIVTGQPRKLVWCDMDTDGGGWTVFLKRQDGSVEFQQDRATYKEGFGDVTGEYWLGLDTLHAITAAKVYEIRADVTDWENDAAYSLHSSFLVDDDSEEYKVHIGSFLEGNGGNALNNNNNKRFSTYDRDLDSSSSNCAETKGGGFWYNSCSYCYPTSKYYVGGTSSADGLRWHTWSKHSNTYSMKTVDLKLRP